MSNDLFGYSELENPTSPPEKGQIPLAAQSRPETLEDLVGHEKVLGLGTPLRTWIETDRVPSLILWGPPGCGKTTIAGIIAHKTHARFRPMSGVLSGVKDIKDAVEQARETQRLMGRKTILFIDEIHRFNKSQQDALLPHVEDGTVILIGATTENPSFSINGALLSRARVIRLERLEPQDLETVLKHALPKIPFKDVITDQVLSFIASQSEGDARRALTMLESLSLALSAAPPQEIKDWDFEKIKSALTQSLGCRVPVYDRAGEEHYNVISAFIKSMRDSDADAALYYLARMIEGGEDPLFIVRRMIIFASEDIGNADPRALMIATSVKEALEMIGMPEGRITLSQGVIYLAKTKKSRAAYDAIGRAMEEVKESGSLPVPMHLRNAVTPLMKSQGYGSAKPIQGGNLPERAKSKKFYFGEGEA